MEWRDVSGYAGLYQVSDTGLVRSVDRMTTGNRNRSIHGKLLKPGLSSKGYFVVALCKDGKPKMKKVHRLVAAAFLPFDEERQYINHKDGNPKNNQIDNLEWCTQSENVKHAYDIGLRVPSSILSNEQIEHIKKVYRPHSREFGIRALARKFGVDRTTICRALCNKNH